MKNNIFGSITQDKASPQSALDARYKPYSSIGVALSDIPLTSRYIGLTIPIIENGILVEYWFQDGILDSNFVKKFIPTNEINIKINNLVQQVQESIREKLAISYVQQLPSTGIQNVLYVAPNGSSESQNRFDEYIWTGSAYERLGAFGAVTVNNYYEAGANINFNYNSSTNLTTISVKNDLYLENNSKKLLIGSLQNYLNSNLASTWGTSVNTEVTRILDNGLELVGLTYIQNNKFNGITIFQHGIYDSFIEPSSICFYSDGVSTGQYASGSVKVTGVDTINQIATTFVSINDTYDFHTFSTAKVVFNEFDTDRARPGFIIYDGDTEYLVNSYRNGFLYSSDVIQYLYGSYDDESDSGSRYINIISVLPDVNEGDGATILFGNNNVINNGITFSFKNGNSPINIIVDKTTEIKGNDTFTNYGSITNNYFGLVFGNKNNSNKYVKIGDNYFYSDKIETNLISALRNYSSAFNPYSKLVLQSDTISVQLSHRESKIRFCYNYNNIDNVGEIHFDSSFVPELYLKSNYFFNYISSDFQNSRKVLLFCKNDETFYGRKNNNIDENLPVFILSDIPNNIYLTPNATPYKAIGTLSTNTGGYGITADGIILYTSSDTYLSVDEFTGSDWASKKAFIRISPYNPSSTPSSSININAKEINLGDEANANYPNGNSVKIKANTFELLYKEDTQDWIENNIKTDNEHIILQRNRSEQSSNPDNVTSQAYIDIKTQANVFGSTEESGEIFIKAGYGENLNDSLSNISRPKTGSMLINASGVRINYWKKVSGSGDIYSGVNPDENAYGNFNTNGAEIGFVDGSNNDTYIKCNSLGITLEHLQENITLDSIALRNLADMLSHYSDIKAGNGW